jgi:hypothetical protein
MLPFKNKIKLTKPVLDVLKKEDWARLGKNISKCSTSQNAL